MDKVFQDFGPGGSRHPDIYHVLQGGRTGDLLIWIRELGYNPQDWAGPWRLPSQGVLPPGGDATTERYSRTVGLTTFVGSNGGSGTIGGGDINPQPPE